MFWNGSTAIDGLSGSASAGRRRRAVEADAIDPHRLRNVLELLLAHVADIKRELSFDLLIGVVGNADRAGAGQRLHPGGDIDSVTVDVALVDDDVTDIDADAELDPAIFGNGGVALRHGALDFHGAAHGIDRACKLDQRTVACRFDDTAAMLRDLGIDEFATVRLERCESAFLVNAHQAAVAGNIGCEDSGQPPFDPRLGHENCPYPRDFDRVYGRGRGVSIEATMSALGQSLPSHWGQTPPFVRC